jgi:hypothetical protein
VVDVATVAIRHASDHGRAVQRKKYGFLLTS